MVNIKNKVINSIALGLLLIPLNIYSQVTGNYSSRDEVSTFVDNMSLKHGFDRNKLMVLLSNSVLVKPILTNCLPMVEVSEKLSLQPNV